MSKDACRCGWDGEGEHPCHGDAYQCRKPATERLVTYPTCLAGMQMKLGAYKTWACDECWREFGERSVLQHKFLDIVRQEGIKVTEGYGEIVYEDDLDAWILVINGEIRWSYYENDPVDGGTWVPALAGIEPENTVAAIEAIHAEVVGDG